MSHRFLFASFLLIASLFGCIGQPEVSPERVGEASAALEGPDLVTVPAMFTVGESWYTRLVTFPKTFALDETEVTVDQYADCVTATECSAPATDTDCNWGVGGRGSHPVNCVTFTQAEEYCAWAGKRLPTQQEWEFGARHNDTRIYPWGDSTSGYETKANTTGSDGYSTTAPVGTFTDGNSALGLKDMAGNVWEWTQSPACFNEDTACTNCPEGESCSNPCDVCETSDIALKGGGYAQALSYSRSAYRTYSDGSAHPTVGFRCALTQ